MLTAERRTLPANAERRRVTSSYVTEYQLALSQGIIPAVPGEYYSYPSVFTEGRPVYVLMKCKSNKARMVSEVSGLGSEVNALFQFEEGNPRIVSAKAAEALGLLEGKKQGVVFDDIWFAPTNLTDKEFMMLRDGRDTKTLVTACTEALTKRTVVLDLHEGLVVAMMTSGGKFGMFLVEEASPSLVQIEACHVLLP